MADGLPESVSWQGTGEEGRKRVHRRVERKIDGQVDGREEGPMSVRLPSLCLI